jgi:hypothetical protein
MKELKEFWQNLNKVLFTNCMMIAAVIFSILLTFIVEFSVEGIQDDVVKTENEIAAYEDEIQLLEVEWVYLTRPDRLRSLASHYLKDNGYALASQIKDEDKMEKFYFANYQKSESSQVAVNDAVATPLSF